MAVQSRPSSASDERSISLQPAGSGMQPYGQQRNWLFDGAEELFRGMYTRAGIGYAPEVLSVSSALTGEGKTTISLGLALTVAQDFPERRVVVVETDAQRPALAADFGLDPAPGLIDHLVGGEGLELAIRGSFLDNLHVLPIGGPAAGPGRPLRSSRMAALVDSLRQSYDLVILDSPAILASSDAILLNDLADGTILVVRTGVTPAPLVAKAIEQVDEAKLRGVILNATQSALPGWLRRLCGL